MTLAAVFSVCLSWRAFRIGRLADLGRSMSGKAGAPGLERNALCRTRKVRGNPTQVVLLTADYTGWNASSGDERS